MSGVKQNMKLIFYLSSGRREKREKLLLGTELYALQPPSSKIIDLKRFKTKQKINKKGKFPLPKPFLNDKNHFYVYNI